MRPLVATRKLLKLGGLWWSLVDDLRTFLVTTDAVSSSANGEILSESHPSISNDSPTTVALGSRAAAPGAATSLVEVAPSTRMVESGGSADIPLHENPRQAEELPTANVLRADGRLECEASAPLAKLHYPEPFPGTTPIKVTSLTPDEKLAWNRARKRFNNENWGRRKKGLPSLPKPATWDMVSAKPSTP